MPDTRPVDDIASEICQPRQFRAFTLIVLAHWVEHLLQGLQIYALGWPVPEARGAAGLFFRYDVCKLPHHQAAHN